MKKLFLFIVFIYISFLFSDPVPPLGDGTQENPYLISCIENLLWVSTYEDFWLPDIYYIQVYDINASETSSWNEGIGFPPIGAIGDGFKANYDGQGHTIDSLYISQFPNEYIGVFAKIDSATICNLNITNLYVRGNDYTGGLAGRCKYSDISNVNIEGHVLGHNYVGIMFGSCYGSFVEDCSASGDLDGWHYMGGIAGRFNSILFSSTTNVDISGVDSAGGIAGMASGAVLYDCVANSHISVYETAGGIAYYLSGSEIYDCTAEFSIEADSDYSGLVVNIWNSEIINSYYNYQTSTFNDEHTVTRFALTDELYNEWLANNMNLDIDDHLNLYSEDIYAIENEYDLTCLLPFGGGQYNFILTADLDLSEMPDFYIPFFNGNFDGNEHSVSGLHVDTPQIDQIGLFGYAEFSNICALHLNDIYVSGFWDAGGLVGKSSNANISNCSIDGFIEGYMNTGGIIGWAEDSQISYCSFSGEVSGNTMAGGIAGRCVSSSIELSYAEGDINAMEDTGGIIGFGSDADVHECFVQAVVYGNTNTGGLVGELSSLYTESLIENCYALGSITGETSTGGLVGRTIYSDVAFCYIRALMNNSTNTGGLIGYNASSDISSCIWDNEYSGINNYFGYNTGNALNLYAADSLMMQDITLYTDIGWDFEDESIIGIEDYWSIDPEINSGFPYLTDLLPPVSQTDPVITVYALITDLKAAPNPFNPQTSICFNLTENIPIINLYIYNIKGQKVWQDYITNARPGYHSFLWQGLNTENLPVSSGVYFFQIIADNTSESGKVILLK
ncbi:MAG: T9SS type A sorting domain-containing protein [Candidatus Cloacimonetes bacterium]|nr:T9SS type A sorting domain-containing protein [Candidatus Cloacimonadota bacterium]